MMKTIAGAGAASRYGSGSDQKMRLLAAPAPQHCTVVTAWTLKIMKTSFFKNFNFVDNINVSQSSFKSVLEDKVRRRNRITNRLYMRFSLRLRLCCTLYLQLLD
jgi:hypothetical protein